MSEVRKFPEITRDDVRKLVARVGDGTIPSADLYRVYREMMAEQGRDPASHRAMSNALKKARQWTEIKYIDRKNVWCWVVKESSLEWLYPEDHVHANR